MGDKQAVDTNRKKGRILQIAFGSLAKAGVQAVIMNIVRGIHDEFDVDILVRTNKKAYYDDEFERYGNIYRINSIRNDTGVAKYIHFLCRPFNEFFRTIRILKNTKYDIVHCHCETNSWPFLLAAKMVGVKTIIVHAHNTASPEKRKWYVSIYRWLGKKAIHLCATLRIGCSRAAAHNLFENDTSIVVNNPVELEMFSRDNKESDLEKDTKNCLQLVHVGRFGYQKNQEFLIEVFREIKKQKSKSTLTLVGFGKEKEKLEYLVECLELSDSVTFMPGSTNIPEVMSKADLMVFPSRYEGLGIVLIEAQAMNIVCVASDCLPEETDVGLCGYISLERDAKSWADYAIELYESLGTQKANKERLRQFESSVIQQVYRDIYSREIGRR